MSNILRKIHLELVAIRKELQAIRKSKELISTEVDVVSRQIQECLTELIEESADSVSMKV